MLCDDEVLVAIGGTGLLVVEVLGGAIDEDGALDVDILLRLEEVDDTLAVSVGSIMSDIVKGNCAMIELTEAMIAGSSQYGEIEQTPVVVEVVAVPVQPLVV